MGEVDLSGVDPLKWAEVRRRIKAVRRYMALEKPTAADREHFAGQLGLGAQQFNNLVKAWRLRRDVNALSPGVRRSGVKSKSKEGGVHPGARALAAELIAERGAVTTLDEMFEAVSSSCAEKSLPVPSRSTVWLLMKEAEEASVGQGDPKMLIGRAFLKMPVDTGRSITFPEVTVAINLPERFIIGATLSVEPDGPDLAEIVTQVRAAQEAQGRCIAVDQRDHDELLRFLPPHARVEPLLPGIATRSLSAAIGRNLGLLAMAYKSPTVRPSTVMQSGRDKAPSVNDATLALRFAIERFNQDHRPSA